MKVLHIGYPKAGSSFIQDEILARVDAPHVISRESMCFDWIPESPQEPAWVKAPRLAQEHPGARIILVVRNPGEWLESWWRHHTRGLTKLGRLPLYKAMQTEFFERCIAPHLHWENVYRVFSRHFADVRVVQYRTLKNAPEKFVEQFCQAADIPVPEGIQYRKVNPSRTHGWCWLRIWMNRAWWKLAPRRWDRAYLYAMKHYISRVDGVIGKARALVKEEP